MQSRITYYLECRLCINLLDSVYIACCVPICAMSKVQFLPNVMRASEWSFMYLRSRGPLLCPMWGPLLCQTSVWASQCYAICATRWEIHSAKVGATVGGRHHRQAACYQPSCHIIMEITIFITINVKLHALNLWQILKILEQIVFFSHRKHHSFLCLSKRHFPISCKKRITWNFIGLSFTVAQS